MDKIPHTQVLNNFLYERSSEEIKRAAEAKAVQVRAKVKEREDRVARLREEYKIDDKALIQLLTEARGRQLSPATVMSYSNSADNDEEGEEVRTVGAGVVQHILTERDLIEQEKDAIEKLETIARCIRPVLSYTESGVSFKHDAFNLSRKELEYLGF